MPYTICETNMYCSVKNVIFCCFFLNECAYDHININNGLATSTNYHHTTVGFLEGTNTIIIVKISNEYYTPLIIRYFSFSGSHEIICNPGLTRFFQKFHCYCNLLLYLKTVTYILRCKNYFENMVKNPLKYYN